MINRGVNLMIDAKTLAFYKDLYNGHKIIYVRFLDTDFVFRTLTRKEYKYIINNESSRFDVEDAICNTSCIYPEDYEFRDCGFAGLNEYVADIIEDLSGFKDVQVILNEYNQAKQFETMETRFMDLIKAFIPEYTYEQMEEWTWEKLIKMGVCAERVAVLRGFEPYTLIDKSEEFNKELSKMNPDNPAFIRELDENGIDPMFYFEDNLKHTFKNEIVEFPLIGGSHWDNEEVLNEIRKQLKKKNNRTSKG